MLLFNPYACITGIKMNTLRYACIPLYKALVPTSISITQICAAIPYATRNFFNSTELLFDMHEWL